MNTELILIVAIVVISLVDYYRKRRIKKDIVEIDSSQKPNIGKAIKIALLFSFLAAFINSVFVFMIFEDQWTTCFDYKEKKDFFEAIWLGYKCNLESTLGIQAVGFFGGLIFTSREYLISYVISRKKNITLFVLINLLIKVLIHYKYYPFGRKTIGYYFEVVFEQQLNIFPFTVLITAFIVWYFNDKIPAK
tara:strand:- start:847 stop:1419 length:573 start_codon:yes stop_codon:yes gene_type:complete